MKQLGMTDKTQIEAMGIDKFNDACRDSVHEVRPRVAELRHPPGALGGLRERLQDAQRRVHGVGALGLQAAARKGPDLQGLPRAAVLLEGRDAAVQPRAAHGRRRLQEPPGPDRHGHLPARGRGDGAVPALAGVQALAWTTTPWTLPTNLALAVGPDVAYVVVPAGPNGVKASAERRSPAASCWPRTCSAPTPRTSGTTTVRAAAAEAAVTSTHTGSELEGLELRAALGLLRRHREVRHAERLADPGGRLRHHHRRHRHRPPGPRLRRGRPEGLRGRRHPRGPLRRRGREVPAAVRHGPLAEIAGLQVFEANKTITKCSRPRAAWSARPATSTATRTAGAAATR